MRSTFEADLRNVVYRWDPDNGRSKAQRLDALFEFVYQTYESSAWIPQSLFDGSLSEFDEDVPASATFRFTILADDRTLRVEFVEADD